MIEENGVLAALVHEAKDDQETAGLILGGSRAAGCADAESDYDVHWVLTDAAYDRRRTSGTPLRSKRIIPGRPPIDIVYTSPRELERLADQPGWWTAGFTDARVLLDKSGMVTPILEVIATMPNEKARSDTAGWFDAYLNAFYRSLKAWRRGDELGARFQAAESMMHLVRTLFSLDRRWPPYHDRLHTQLDALAGQGWPPGYLHKTILLIVSTGDPRRQQELEARVEALLRARGFDVLDHWGGEIERVKAFRFDRD